MHHLCNVQQVVHFYVLLSLPNLILTHQCNVENFSKPNLILNDISVILILIITKWIEKREKNILRWVALLDLDELIIPSKAAGDSEENQVKTTFS